MFVNVWYYNIYVGLYDIYWVGCQDCMFVIEVGYQDFYIVIEWVYDVFFWDFVVFED